MPIIAFAKARRGPVERKIRDLRPEHWPTGRTDATGHGLARLKSRQGWHARSPPRACLGIAQALGFLLRACHSVKPTVSRKRLCSWPWAGWGGILQPSRMKNPKPEIRNA